MEYKGLTNDEVNIRIKENKINTSDDNITKSYKELFISNVFTLFNFINFVLAALVIMVGSYQNLTFIGVIICNTLIGIYQEIKAKKILDKLNLINKSKINVIRNNQIVELYSEDIVIDDIILLKAGNQIYCDSIILEGTIEINESAINGESDIVTKVVNDTIYSGCYVVSGNAHIKVINVGHDNYINKIMHNAKKQLRYNSQLRDTLNKILKVISYIIIPIGTILFLKHYIGQDLSFELSITSTVAAMIGMIPEGLILLTSVALALGSINLAKRKTLVQELYCIETLARVDVLCLDKTGTITTGEMSYEEIIKYDNTFDYNLYLRLISTYLNNDNSTSLALSKTFEEIETDSIINSISFSSERKFSAIQTHELSFYIGAYEYLVNDVDTNIINDIKKYTNIGRRVISIGITKDNISKNKPSNIKIIGHILLIDPIRKEAKDTLEYFRNQGVAVKIISGDNPETVNGLAKQAGFNSDNKFIDTSSLTDEELKEVVLNYNIFGRVKPEQKQLIIKTLKEAGHTVSMVGDGVNDVLALKESDCSISVASGCDCAKGIANLILLDNNFSNIPYIVDEGRRVINNIERSASLFLVKTIFSIILSIITIFTIFPYPFQPIQLTIISTITIGIPGFLLALEANYSIIKGSFLYNVFSKAIPGALNAITWIIIAQVLGYTLGFNSNEISSLVVLFTGVSGLAVINQVCKPYTIKRSIIFISMITLFTSIYLFAILFGNEFFLMDLLTIDKLLLAIGCSCVVPFTLNIYYYLFNIIRNKYEMKKS